MKWCFTSGNRRDVQLHHHKAACCPDFTQRLEMTPSCFCSQATGIISNALSLSTVFYKPALVSIRSCIFSDKCFRSQTRGTCEAFPCYLIASYTSHFPHFPLQLLLSLLPGPLVRRMRVYDHSIFTDCAIYGVNWSPRSHSSLFMV